MRELTTQVYVDLEGTPHHVGLLHTHIRNGRERATLEYVDSWREHRDAFPLAPALSVDHGQHHTRRDRGIFAPLTDSAPDRWGRQLIARQAAREAREEGRTPRTLYEIDYLLGVSDLTRQGALRFARETNGPYLADTGDEPVPPLVDLPRLLRASDRLLTDSETREDLQLLVNPGSSLGGARPKASVRGDDGTLMIAKFPARGDEWNLVRWEAVALTLAENAGITAPVWKLHDIDGDPVLMLERFDRRGKVRRPYLSAMSMLDAIDHETRSYAEIADAIRRHGSSPDDDIQALWRRLAFNILISNTDDHLRNHGFLYERPGWTLSPVFDVNPVPREARPRVLSTPVWIDDDPTASLEIAIAHAAHFRLDEQEAHEIVSEVGSAVAEWRDVASQLELSGGEIRHMSSAFEHDDLEWAAGL